MEKSQASLSTGVHESEAPGAPKAGVVKARAAEPSVIGHARIILNTRAIWVDKPQSDGGTVLTLLTWNHECSVGIRAIDDQHGILMDAINELSLSLVHGSSRDQLGVLIERIIEFTRMHFSSEEQLMEMTGYPGLAEHRTAHVEMLHRIRAGAHLLQYDPAVDMRSLLSALRDGFRDHIASMDRLYSPWLIEWGLV